VTSGQAPRQSGTPWIGVAKRIDGRFAALSRRRFRRTAFMVYRKEGTMFGAKKVNGAHGATNVALLPTRAALGSTMLFHGLEKLRPRGREQAASGFEALGIKPGRAWSLATGIAEVAAGALTWAGLLTRPAALAVIVTQAVAVAKVHGSKGFANTKGGFEFNLALIAIAAGLLLAGPGHVSAHRALTRRFGASRRWFGRARTPWWARLLELSR
jgi:putative oxidoreductase